MVRFSDYAREWLYGENGYYGSYKSIGKRGDFYTSVSVTPFFGGAIAKHIISRVAAGKLREDSAIVEIGAHGARLIADAIQFIHTLEPRLIGSLKFAIVEPIAALRLVQSEYLKASFGDAISVTIAPSIEPIAAASAFVYANELLDAFAFDLIDGDKVAFVQNDRVVWRDGDDRTLERARALEIERGELFCGYEAFAASLKANFESCEFLTFDYGELTPRNDFSARIYKEHETIPLFAAESLAPYFAQCDLSADAPFWHIKKAFEDAGFESAEIKNQNSALLEMGLIDLLEMYQEKAGFAAYQKEIGRIRALLDPAQLGERFKRFVATR
ncbi:MAG: SAM-dependent methyltransferase [Helicobacteraceae bacterium]|jgi:SAM-dependent MidA family methyltransferase|nr:SAM-dependent methyltransferase [Helicobacteraceae bacterium]